MRDINKRVYKCPPLQDGGGQGGQGVVGDIYFLPASTRIINFESRGTTKRGWGRERESLYMAHRVIKVVQFTFAFRSLPLWFDDECKSLRVKCGDIAASCSPFPPSGH